MLKKSMLMLMAGFLVPHLSGCGDDGEGSDADVDVTQDQVADDAAQDDALADTPTDIAEDDAASDPTQDTQADDAQADDAQEEEVAAVCEPPQSPGPGAHHAGGDCLSCHGSMGADLRWTVAGTLYSDPAGSSPVSGATIVVSDAAGKERKLVTGGDGNFYTTEAFTFPLDVAASKCPDHQEMIEPLESGSCNASACHGNSSFRIHLP